MRNMLQTFFLLMSLFCGLFATEGWTNSSHESSSHSTFSCSPVPPSCFCASIENNLYEKEDIVHVLTWVPSPDPRVINYKVFQGDKLIKETHKHRVVIHHRQKISYRYKLVAVDSRGRESAPLSLRVVPNMSSETCTNCPEFAVIPPSISIGGAGTFFSQNFTTNSCVNDPIFSTDSVLPEGLTLFPDGVLSGTPTQLGTFPIIVTATTDPNCCSAPSPVYNLTIICDVKFTTQIANPTCNGLSNGSLTIHVTKGNSPFSYSINGSAFQASNVFYNLAAGTYAIVVKDASGCTAQGSATLINPPTLAFTTTNVNPLCNGQASGSITFQAIGGTPPYLFSIDGGSSFQSSNVFTGLNAGVYSLKVMDANMCSVSGSAPLINPPAITFTTIIADVCTGGAVPQRPASITINASGGTGSFTYSNDGGATFQSSNIFSNLSANTYFLVVKDSNGCTSFGMATVSQSAAPLLNITSSSCIAGSCTVTLAPSGGTPPFTFTIAPSGGGTPTSNSTGIFSGLTCGATYTTAVVDSQGCSGSAGNVTCSP